MVRPQDALLYIMLHVEQLHFHWLEPGSEKFTDGAGDL